MKKDFKKIKVGQLFWYRDKLQMITKIEWSDAHNDMKVQDVTLWPMKKKGELDSCNLKYFKESVEEERIVFA